MAKIFIKTYGYQANKANSLLVKEIRPEVVNISKFSSRHGTKASLLKQLPSQEIKRRSNVITELYNSL